MYIRLRLNESPVFRRIKSENRASKQPLTESFFHYPNNKFVLLALLGATAGQGVVWYTGQFYALFFLQDHPARRGAARLHPRRRFVAHRHAIFVLFGKLSDRIGRLKIILAGCLLAALTYVPLFKGLTHYVNPDLETFSANVPVSVAAGDCNFISSRPPERCSRSAISRRIT